MSRIPCLASVLLLTLPVPTRALIDDGRAGDPGELFLALWDAGSLRSYYKDLGITLTDFLRNPAGRFDLRQDPAYAEFLGKPEVVYNIAAVYPLRNDLANVNTWGYLSTSGGGPEVFSADFFTIQDVYQRIQGYISVLNPAPFGGTQEERDRLRAENLSGGFGPEDAGYFDSERWGLDLGQGVDGVTTGRPNRPLAFFQINNPTGDRSGELIHPLGSWMLTTTGLLQFSTGDGGNIDLPPLADAGYNQKAAPGAPVSLHGEGSGDPEGNTLSYLWAWQSGPVRVDPDGKADSPIWSFTAPDRTGDYVFRLTVSDGANQATATTTVHVESAVANLSPVAVAGEDQTVVAGATVSLDGGGSSDPDHAPQPLGYAWTWINGPVRVEPQAGDRPEIANFVAPAIPGDYLFDLAVSDGVASAHDTVTIRVSPPPANIAPIADPGPDHVVGQGDTVVLDGSASRDPDGGPDALRHAWRQTAGPKAALHDAASVSARFVAEQAGSYEFELSVSDGEAETSHSLHILVNAPPLANAGEAFTALPGREIVLDGAASSDPDGLPLALSYAWSQTQGPPVQMVGAVTAQARFAPVETGTYAFRLVVSDGAAEAETGVLVTVQRVRLDAPELWKAGKRDRIGWSLAGRHGRRVRVAFAKNGVDFVVLARVSASRGGVYWLPKRRQATHEGVLRVCLSGARGEPPVCDSQEIAVQP